MTVGRSAVSLLSLDAMILDIETTGLDVRKARVVEFAVMPLQAGRPNRTSAVRRLVNPKTPIPAHAVRIHGIDNAAVADAPDFASLWPELSSYVKSAILIGHTLNFDVAVLRQECGRIGQSFEPQYTLDIRLLGEVAEPRLADFSLERLAAAFGVEVVGRHSALGDVITTGAIFCALVPRLRDRGIRTLGEAYRATADVAPVSSVGGAAGRREAPADATIERDGKRRLDSHLYSQRVESLMTAPPVVAAAEATLSEAMSIMARTKRSSVFVSSGNGLLRPVRMGVVTERDALRAVVARGSQALQTPLGKLMTCPLWTIPADSFAYQAVARMNRLGIRHLGVTDAEGNVIGAISARDLLRLRAEAGFELGDEIAQSADVHGLARAWTKLPQVAAELLEEGLSARQVAAVISHRTCELTGRIGAVVEDLMKAEGSGGPPSDYSLLVLGSASRGESLLAMDQDNALVFADDAPDDGDRWFEVFGQRVADMLHQVGVPYCKGGVMAKNPEWRGSRQTWEKRIEQWVARANPRDLLSVDLFFDLRAVNDQTGLGEALRRQAYARARGQSAFAKQLIEVSGAMSPAFNWYGGIRTVNGRIDLKKAGLFGIVRSARALAICQGIAERSTFSRVEAIKALHPASDADLAALTEAQDVFLDLILRQQITDIEHGRPPDNTVEIGRLSRRQREGLRHALKAIEHLDEMTHALLFEA